MKHFNQTTLTAALEQCRACRDIITHGSPVFISRDVFVCDEICAAEWRQDNERGDEKYLNRLAVQFN